VIKNEWNNILHFAAKNVFLNVLKIEDPKLITEVNLENCNFFVIFPTRFWIASLF